MANSPNQFFEQHRGFAKAQAHLLAKKLPRHVSRDDILSFAERGLWEASERFDPERHNSFVTFAYYRIRGAIYDEIRRLSLVPPRVLKAITQMAAQDDYLENGLPAPRPSDSAKDQANQLSETIRGLGAVFLASQVADEDGNERIDAVDESNPADAAVDADLSAKLKEVKATLPDRQRQILKMHYEDFVSFTDIAKQMKVNKATVSREHARAIETLKVAVTVESG